MAGIEFLKRNAITLIITGLFVLWISYLIITDILATRTIEFYNVLTTGDIEDVSSLYISEVPILRYFIEPFVGLTFIFGFNSDPTEILPLFLIFYLIIRLILLLMDNSILNRNEKKHVFYIYLKNTLEFFTKYASIIVFVSATFLVTGYLTQGFLFVANYFEITFHISAILGFMLLVGKALFNLLVYVHPKLRLKHMVAKPKTISKKIFVRFRRELFYFWTAFLILFSFNFTFLSIRFPTHTIQAIDLAPDEVLCDFHVHTTMSDGHLSPEQRVLWYIQQGIHVAAFSDHHHPRGAQRAKAFVEKYNLDFTVLIAQEFTDDPEDIHLNIFGIEEELTPEGYTEGSYGTNQMNCSEVIKWVKDRGGYVIVNHYGWNATAPFTYEQLRDWGVDGFEIDNQPEEIRDFCLNNNLICLGGTDEHLNRELNMFIRLKLTDPSNKTLDHIFENLARNNHSVVVIPSFDYFHNFPKSPVNKLQAFNSYLLNLDEFQSFSWIIWSCILYVSMILIIKKVKKVDKEKLRKKIEEI
ncbi:MAG TPA: hypothetical protein VMV49_18580 [Candidatus Deferrimicrobium sp.]|nr:hypothetical protein [Candidatus Deferrimicrobium sp.]